MHENPTLNREAYEETKGGVGGVDVSCWCEQPLLVISRPVRHVSKRLLQPCVVKGARKNTVCVIANLQVGHKGSVRNKGGRRGGLCFYQAIRSNIRTEML